MERKNVMVPQEELEEQRDYCARVRAFSQQRLTPPLAMVDTYGCQQNEADSERIRGLLEEMGYGFTDDEREADVIVINTCAVREHAEMRVLGNVGALTHTKKNKPDQVICVGGFVIGRTVGDRLSGRAEVLGGAILVFIGLEIFIKGVF